MAPKLPGCMGHFPGGSSEHLVDREAIDYEAAAAAYSDARQNGNAPRYPATEADRMWSRKIVEAAIGDTE